MISLVSNFFKGSLRNDPHINIIAAAPIEVGCSSNSQCPPSQVCRNRGCVNPCSVDNPCGILGICTSSNHRASCACPPGFIGDAYTECSQRRILLIYYFIPTSTHLKLLQLQQENALLTRTVLKANPVSKVPARTHVMSLTHHVVRALIAKPSTTGQFANVLLVGLETHMKFASNVSHPL